LNHFGIIEVLDAQRYRDLKIDGPSVDLKRDANLSIPVASPGGLDARHFDLEFCHGLTWIRAAPDRCSDSPLAASQWTEFSEATGYGIGASRVR
jgi:hypothetical protein